MSAPDTVFLRAVASLRDALTHVSADQATLAVSGGADSLALARTAAFLQKRGEMAALAVVVDHGLQAGSDDAARAAAARCREMGLDAEVIRVDVTPQAVKRDGLEAAARQARYEALASVGHAVLTAHTLSDQAEQVLLGLVRGSGIRSLAGIRRVSTWDEDPLNGLGVVVVRPFIHPTHGLWREDTEHLARDLNPWTDPTNLTADRPRTFVRLNALPALEESFPGIRGNLVRTADLAAQDADFLDAAAEEARARVSRGAGLSVAGWRGLHPALQTRVIALEVERAGAPRPTLERVREVARLMTPREEGGSVSAGPVQLPGVTAWRRRIPGESGKMEMILVLERAQ
jgi:tRNA(Ile)-lysidine synthase